MKRNDDIQYLCEHYYKGYKTHIRYSVEDNVYYGKIENIDDLVLYESPTLAGAYDDFLHAVDDYIAFKK